MVKLNKKMKKSQTGGGGGGNKQAMQFNHALGQHILKNPLIIQALVEKVFYFYIIITKIDFGSKLIFSSPHYAIQTRCWKLVPELVISLSKCWRK